MFFINGLKTSLVVSTIGSLTACGIGIEIDTTGEKTAYRACLDCSKSPKKEGTLVNYSVLREIPALEQCKHEALPLLSEDTQSLYLYALYQDLHLQQRALKQRISREKQDAIRAEFLPYYRIAAANGDWKATRRLRDLNDSESQQNINFKAQRPIAYAYEKNAKDPENYVKFSQLGIANAQYQVGKYLDVKFTPHLSGAQLNILWERAITYYQCAASQGHPRAALELFYYYVDKDPSRALGALQQAAKFGEPQAFNMLSNLFSQRNKQWNSYFPNLDEDQERAKRYQKIASMLTSSGLELESTESNQIDLWDIPYQVTDLDDIVPLPDVTLPVWDGKTAFLRWLNSPSPAKPSDELMKRLAAKANLDWQTGL